MGIVKSIVGIPGPWRDEADLGAALSRGAVELRDGRLCSEGGNFDDVAVELYRHDAQLETAFRLAGAYSCLGRRQLRQIAKHRTCAYLIIESADIRQRLGGLLGAATAVLDAGGIAVKVESAGRSHTAEEWRSVRHEDAVALVDTFVTWVGRDGERSYSCGMHNLGERDVTVPSTLDATEAFEALRTFCCYLAVDDPEIVDRDTMALAEGGPTYRIRDDRSTWPEDHSFYNPFGVWSLWRVEPEVEDG